MDDHELYALGGMTHSSPAMFDRRRRILHATRQMIMRYGIDGFSVAELCKCAEISRRTLYNAFGSKEKVVSLAIQQYVQQFDELVHFDSDPTTLDGAIERQITQTLRVRAIPNYLRTITMIYFSVSVPGDIRQVLHDAGARDWLVWLEKLVPRHQLQKGVSLQRLGVSLSQLQYALVQEWAAGMIGDDDLLPFTMMALLDMVAGTTRGQARADVIAWRHDIAQSGPRAVTVISAAQERISHMSNEEPLTADQQL